MNLKFAIEFTIALIFWVVVWLGICKIIKNSNQEDK